MRHQNAAMASSGIKSCQGDDKDDVIVVVVMTMKIDSTW